MNDFNHNRKRAFLLALAGIAGLIVVFLFRPGAEPQFQAKEGIVWNTTYSIVYRADSALDDSVMATLRKIELSVSPFNKMSRITAINENRTDTLDYFLRHLYTASRKIAEESDGAFDPTVSPLINAWGFGYKQEQLPDSATVDSLLQIVGITRTSLNGNILKKSDPRTTFNFSAIAKGFGCDEIGRMLARNGATDYLVEIGGEITAAGRNPKGQKWRVSIDKPISSSDHSVIHESALAIAIDNCGVATSGNYRNFHTDSLGRRYAHIIDPATGRPTASDILSATVVAPDCMTADAYATTFMILGKSKTVELAAQHPELAVMLITADIDNGFDIWQNEAFRQLVVRQANQ